MRFRIAPREVVFSATMLAIFIVAVEATIVATAMPTIVADLGGLRYFSWVFGAYLLTQTVMIPIYGRLADFFGRKALLVIAIGIFLAGSILCGFAHSMVALILFRALQGIGAGGVQPVASTIVGDLYSGRERARAQGYLSSCWAFSAVIAPLLGAFLIQNFGWPIIFWVNVPFGLACCAIIIRRYHENVAHVVHQIDYLGSALLALGIGTLMFVLVMAGDIPVATGAALGVFAVVVLVLLAWHELRTPEPMMPLNIYRIRVIAVANAGNFFIGALVMGVTAFMPTFVQGSMGHPAVVAGSVLGSMFVAWTTGAVGGARLQLYLTYRSIAFIASLAVIIGSAILALLDAHSNIALAFAGIMPLGLGFGMMNSIYVIATQAAVGWEQRGAATSSNIFLRQIGQSMGSAAFGAVFNIGVYAAIPDAGRVVAQLVDPVRRMAVPAAELARDVNAIAASMHDVFLIQLVLAVAIGAITLALPPKLGIANVPSREDAQAG